MKKKMMFYCSKCDKAMSYTKGEVKLGIDVFCNEGCSKCGTKLIFVNKEPKPKFKLNIEKYYAK